MSRGTDSYFESNVLEYLGKFMRPVLFEYSPKKGECQSDIMPFEYTTVSINVKLIREIIWRDTSGLDYAQKVAVTDKTKLPIKIYMDKVVWYVISDEKDIERFRLLVNGHVL